MERIGHHDSSQQVICAANIQQEFEQLTFIILDHLHRLGTAESEELFSEMWCYFYKLAVLVEWNHWDLYVNDYEPVVKNMEAQGITLNDIYQHDVSSIHRLLKQAHEMGCDADAIYEINWVLSALLRCKIGTIH